MAKKIIGAAVALTIAIVVFLPFIRDFKDRYVIERQLQTRLNPSDLAALQQWSGSPDSFIAMLRERCEIAYGAGAPNCQQYRTPTN